MSAFKRKAPASAPSPPGTRRSPYNGSVLLSLGLASLDDILGGGLPLGCLLLIEEDAVSSYSRLLLKYWVAQALCCSKQEATLIAPSGLHGGSCAELADALMEPETADMVEEPKASTSKAPTADAMKIAFRYEGLKKFETSVRGVDASGRYVLLFQYV
jgi:elongator complex protein 4